MALPEREGEPAPAAPPPLITFREATLGYGRRAILPGVRLVLRQGDFLGVVGPNGAGKTTLLRALLGSLRPLSGAIEYGRPLQFGYVPQGHTMEERFPLTALEIALMGRYRRLGPVRRPSASDRERARQALAEVGLADRADQLFRELSGGQKQRTLMARALAAEPDVLVLDEPTSDMDIAAEQATMELVDRLHAGRGLTVVLVSHVMNVVVNHARTLAIVHDGRLEIGPVGEMATAERLERLYGRPFTVAEVAGKRVVL